MNCYFFIDGSALLADIARCRRELGYPEHMKFDLRCLVRYFSGPKFSPWHYGSYRRFVFYFVSGDARLETDVIVPQAHLPGDHNDTRIEYCGKRIPGYKKAHDWLRDKNAPDFVQESLYRSEKAVDTRICCDAMHLAATGKMDRLFLYTNDYDFVPLFHSLRILGCNINLFRLSMNGVNRELAAESDALHEIERDVLATLYM